MPCEFTLEHYFDTLKKAQDMGYEIKPVSGSKKMSKRASIFLRHDVDFSLDYALTLAKAEHENNIHSTYYILSRDDFYNPLSKRNIKIIQEINDMGHEIGLHYDGRFTTTNTRLKHELDILNDALEDKKITSISAHIPNEIKRLTGKSYLEDQIDLEKLDIIESKNVDAKYISDSARTWREGCMCQHIGKHKNEHGGLKDLQILTHPVWWINNTGSIHEQMIRMKSYFVRKYLGYIKDYKEMAKKFMVNNNISEDRYKI